MSDREHAHENALQRGGKPVVPAVSVLMAVYNGARYLARAMDSILAQTFGDFEVIVIDDGSTDDSRVIVHEYAARDTRIRFTARVHRGLTVTLNDAFSQSRGSYLARLDCDDIALPERFAAQVEWLEAHPEVSCVGGGFELIDAAGRFLTTLWPPPDDDAIQGELLKGHAAINHSAAMIRRSAMGRVGGYDTRFETAQDLDLWLRLGEVGRLANLPQTVVRVRLHPASISETKGGQQRKMGRTACEEAWRRRGLTGITYEADAPWRPGTDRASRHYFALRYGWWAFNNRQRRTALIYGAKAIAAMPFRLQGWTLIACAILKPFPRHRLARHVEG